LSKIEQQSFALEKPVNTPIILIFNFCFMTNYSDLLNVDDF